MAGAIAAPGPASALPPGSTPREIELGDEAAKDIDDGFEFVEDDEALAKLQEMVDEIAAASPRPEIEYRVRIVDTPGVNAFVLPGGHVYVTKGLLEMVESDDELAGVLCHEVAHNVDQHAIRRMREAPTKRLTLLQLATLVAQATAVVKGAPEGAILASAAANHVAAAVLNPGSVEAEIEADHDGIEYMTRTHYNPAGFLTFMERLASTSGKFYEEALGIYNTHPLTRDRVLAAKNRLEELEVPVYRRLVTDVSQPSWHRLDADGNVATEIRYLNDRLLLLDGYDEERAARAVDTIAWALDHELGEEHIRIRPAEDGVVFAPDGGPPLALTREDAARNGVSDLDLADRLRGRIASWVADDQARVRANYQLY
ncbi:MAG: M48 family metalloprotease [bacterium]